MASIASRQLLAYQIEATRPLIVGQWSTAKNIGLQEQNINISNPQGKTKRDVVPQKEREIDGQKRERGGRMQCFMKKEDKRLIDVEHVETTYFDNCAFFAALASFLLQFCLIHLSLLVLSHSVQHT